MIFNWLKKRQTSHASSVSAASEGAEPVRSVPSAMARTAESDLGTDDRSETVVTTLPRELDIPREKIAARAYEIWDRNGRRTGTGVQDWLAAEAELRAEWSESSPEPLPPQSR